MDHSARPATPTTPHPTDGDVRWRLVAWLQTDDARSAARADLHRLGLDVYEPDDLLNDVAVALLRAQLPTDLDNPVGYARRSLQRRATDLLRGELTRRDHQVVARPHDGEDDGRRPSDADDRADDAAPTPDDVAVLAASEDGIRRALFAALGATRTWTVSAALSTLTLLVHPDVALPDDAPTPGTGLESANDRWAALWLAGERDAFPDDDHPDTPARRKARSRKLNDVVQLLQRVAAAVLGGRGDDDD